MKSEAIYFGTVGNATGNVGSLWRMTVAEKPDPADWGTPFKLLAANQPFQAQPSVTIDNHLRTWVIAGTGRALIAADKSSTSQQTLYGIIDPNPLIGSTAVSSATAVSVSGLTDVTNAHVRINGDVDLNGDGAIDTTFNALSNTVVTTGGWKRNYQIFTSPNPSERSPNRSTLFDGLILNAAFTPSLNQCTSQGTSRLYVLAFETGTPLPDANIGSQAAFCGTSCPVGTVKEAVPYIDLGIGMASTPAIHFGPVASGDAAALNGSVDSSGTTTATAGGGTVFDLTDTGQNNARNLKDRGGITDGEISWREYRSTQ
jgi:type IV pilus assembly protein PilY1